ncbi:hypothetical protein AB0D12_23720 [Streptomyces sp. NPDC048479]|uniref:hypothetical protein n=1 Tax=Streptomyces sp. NPDC048479 TaxID=3154725 RepID=UPI00342FB66A
MKVSFRAWPCSSPGRVWLFSAGYVRSHGSASRRRAPIKLAFGSRRGGRDLCWCTQCCRPVESYAVHRATGDWPGDGSGGRSVRGSVVLRGARFHNPSDSGLALNAARLRVGVDLDLRGGLVAYGTIDLCDARVGGSVLLEGADLTAHDSQPALRGNGIETGGVLNLCDGFTAHGRISLNSVTVRSRLCFDDAALDVPAGGTALSCRGSSAATLSLHTREASAGIIDLRQSRFGMLRDDPAAWPAGLVLDGAVYDSVQPALPARTRLPWLGRDPAGFVPQPYEQLAATCQRQGQDAEARTVLVAKHRSMRPTLTPPARL